LQNPDYEKTAASFGMAYLRMERDSDIAPILGQVWKMEQPVLVEVRVSYEQMSPFLKGIVRHRVWVTPWREKLHVARRWIRRTIFPAKEDE